MITIEAMFVVPCLLATQSLNASAMPGLLRPAPDELMCRRSLSKVAAADTVKFLLACLEGQAGESGCSAALAVLFCLRDALPPSQILQAGVPLLRTLTSEHIQVSFSGSVHVVRVLQVDFCISLLLLSALVDFLHVKEWRTFLTPMLHPS